MSVMTSLQNRTRIDLSLSTLVLCLSHRSPDSGIPSISQDIQYFRRINVLEDPSGGPVETKGGKSDIGDEFGANDQQAAKRPENDANGPVGQEDIKGEEDTSQPQNIDPREPKAREDDTLQGSEFNDPTLTLPGNVQMTPDAASPTPSPPKHGAKEYLPAYSTSSSQSSVCLDDVLSKEDIIIAYVARRESSQL